MQIRCAICGRGVQVADTGVLPAKCPHCERPPVPERLGRFRILKLLAAGGMGEVYLGEHEELSTKVAIKLLPIPPGEDPTALRERFWREARLTAAIEHPGVVQVLDLCEEDGRLYLVLELVAGRSLRSRLGDGLLPLAEAQRIAIAIAEIVTAAHERGVIHRDLKPENVMLMPNGDVRVLDFGLARALQDHEPLTRTGEILGTPEYMAPEQLLDTAEATTTQTDVHGLGVLTYELLTGRSPFGGQTMFQALKLVESLVPPPPSTVREPAAGDDREQIDPAVDAVVLRALAKDPAERPKDAAAFANELRTAWHGSTVAAGAAPATTRGRWLVVFATVAIAVGAVGFSLGNLLDKSGRDEDSTKSTEAPADNALTPATLRANLIALSRTPWQIQDADEARRLVRWHEAYRVVASEPHGQGSTAADAATGRIWLRLGQPHRALRTLEAPALASVPGARETAVAAWFAGHAAAPMALDLPPWCWRLDRSRQERLLGEPIDEKSAPLLHAWQLVAEGKFRDAFRVVTELAAEDRSPSSAMLAALCINRLGHVPSGRRAQATPHVEGLESPLIALLLDTPLAAPRRLDALRREAPPIYPDRWLFALLATAGGQVNGSKFTPPARLDAMAEQAWLTGAGEAAIIWSAGTQAMDHLTAERARALAAQVAPMNLKDNPGGVPVTMRLLMWTEGVPGVTAFLDGVAPATDGPLPAFWRKATSDQRRELWKRLTEDPSAGADSGDPAVESFVATLDGITAARLATCRRIGSQESWRQALKGAVNWELLTNTQWIPPTEDLRDAVYQGGMGIEPGGANAEAAWRGARTGHGVSATFRVKFAKELWHGGPE